jgi:hypothetical protein
MKRLRALQNYFQKNPPVHKLVAMFVGYRPPEKAADQPGGALSLMFPGGTIKV